MKSRTSTPETTLREFATVPPVAIPRATTLGDAARAMRSNDVSSVLVGDPHGDYRVLTERDLTEAVAHGLGPGSSVTKLPRTGPRTIDCDATVRDAAVLMMRFGVRHLVVVCAGDAVGVVSIRDALEALVRAGTPTLAAAVHQALTTRPDCWLG